MVTRQQAEDRVNAGFWSHLFSYIVVVSALAVLNYQRNPDNLWVLWVAGGWGIGIVAHALAYFSDRGKMVDRTIARMDRREQRQERREERREERQEERQERREQRQERHDAKEVA